MILENFLSPSFIFNLLGGGVFLLVFWRLNTFSKTSLGETIKFAKYFSRAFLFFAFYFLIIIPPTTIFIFPPQLFGIFHWIGDVFLYLGFSQSILSLFLLISPQLFHLFQKIIYLLILIFIFAPFSFYVSSTTNHQIYPDLGLIFTLGIPKIFNYLPFLLWMLTFLSLGLYFLLQGIKLEDKFAKRRAIIISIALLLFVLGYPLGRILYFLNFLILSPAFSFFLGAAGFYFLSFTSCLVGVYSILIKKQK